MRPLAFTALFACTQAAAPPLERSVPPEDAIATGPTTATLLPLAGEWLQTLRDKNGRTLGVIAVPLGAREPRRIIVGVHGAVSRADFMCSVLRSVTGPRDFVLCPHSSERTEQDSSWQSGAHLRARTEEAFAAMEREYGAYLDASRVTYFGHSQGAMTVPYAFTQHSAIRWGTVVFFEGLPREPERVAPAMRAMGADHVVLISGQRGWEPGHRALANHLNRNGISATHVASSFGHFATPDVLRVLLGSLPNEW
jgi:predicted esterase